MIKILTVDDDGGICKFLKDYLERDKTFQVFIATTQGEAMATAAKERPRVVLLDIKMPPGEFGGLDTLKRLKELDRAVKVVMVTIIDDKEVVDQALRLGADGYVTKPFSLDYLDDVVVKKIIELAGEDRL